MIYKIISCTTERYSSSTKTRSGLFNETPSVKSELHKETRSCKPPQAQAEGLISKLLYLSKTTKHKILHMFGEKKKKTTNQPQTSKQMNITPARLRKPGTPYLSCHQYQLRIHLKKDWPPELLSTAQSCSLDVKPTENGSWSCGKDGMSTEPCRHLEASQPYSRTRQDLMLCHLHFCGFRIFSNLLKGNTDKQLTQIHPDSSWAQPVPVSPAISCQFCPFPYPEFCV